MCVHMSGVRSLFPKTFPQTCTAAGEYSSWTSASASGSTI